MGAEKEIFFNELNCKQFREQLLNSPSGFDGTKDFLSWTLKELEEIDDPNKKRAYLDRFKYFYSNLEKEEIHPELLPHLEEWAQKLNKQ